MHSAHGVLSPRLEILQCSISLWHNFQDSCCGKRMRAAANGTPWNSRLMMQTGHGSLQATSSLWTSPAVTCECEQTNSAFASSFPTSSTQCLIQVLAKNSDRDCICWCQKDEEVRRELQFLVSYFLFIYVVVLFLFVVFIFLGVGE